MDRTLIFNHLAQAEQHVLQGEEHVMRQRELVAELERDGHDTTEAQALLAQLEDLQTLHIADRDRLREEASQEIAAGAAQPMNLVRPIMRLPANAAYTTL